MLKIGIFPNSKKQNVLAIIDWIMQVLIANGVRPVLPQEDANNLGYPDYACRGKEIGSCIDMAIAVGGDGTLLCAARQVARAGVPIFGLNMGRLGFLTEVEVPQLSEHLLNLIRGDYFLEKRMMLDAFIVRGKKERLISSGLNDVVVTRAGYSRMIQLDVKIDSADAGSFSADGLILSTPTGSTGYSLSAGGPIVKPELQVILITPICPHTLYSRPLVISSEEVITVTASAFSSDIVVNIDGQVTERLETTDKIIVKRSAFDVSFIRFGKKSYYQTIRTKLWRDEDENV